MIIKHNFLIFRPHAPF